MNFPYMEILWYSNELLGRTGGGGLEPLPQGFNPPTPAKFSPPYPAPFLTYFLNFLGGVPLPQIQIFCPRPPPISPPPIFSQKPPTPAPLTPGTPSPLSSPTECIYFDKWSDNVDLNCLLFGIDYMKWVGLNISLMIKVIFKYEAFDSRSKYLEHG